MFMDRLKKGIQVAVIFLLAFWGFGTSNATAEIVQVSDARYTYEEMLNDIKQLEDRFRDIVSVKTIGKSVLKRDIVVVILGNPSAEKKILIHGSMHAREYMTTQLIMKQMEYYLQSFTKLTYNSKLYKDILDKVAIYYVPMVNPDGVSLSQKGLSSVTDSKLKIKLLSFNNGSNDFKRWKANIRGVDLNRNYSSDWENNATTRGPAPLNYKGPSPDSEPETQALTHLTKLERFDATISYHAKGSIIYWYCLQKGNEYKRDKQLSDKLINLTGYRPVKPENDPGSSYKDWYIINFGGPAYTIEIGKNDTPLGIGEFPDIWKKNKYTGIFLAYEIMNLPKTVEAPGIFIDVNRGYWAEKQIKYLVDKGVISGIKEGYFKPNSTVTRTEAVVTIVKTLGLPLENTGKEFKDLDSKHWARKYILTAEKYGIVNGYSDGSFGPGKPVTRAQAAVMLAQAYKLSSKGEMFSLDINKDYWAYDHINKLVTNGLANGYGDGSFKPNNLISRAQFAVFLAKAEQTFKN